MLKALRLVNLLLTKGFYSPEYYELFTKLRTNDYRQAYPVKPAIDDRFKDHFFNVKRALEADSRLSNSKLEVNKLPFGSTFRQFIKAYGKPNLYTACFECGISLRVAAHKGSAGSLQYKTLFYFVDKAFVMSEFNVYNGTDEQHLTFLKQVLSSRGIVFPDEFHSPETMKDAEGTVIQIVEHPFKLTTTSFCATDPVLLHTCKVLCDTSGKDSLNQVAVPEVLL